MPGQRSTVIVGLSQDSKTAIGWTSLTDDEITSPVATFVLDVASSTFTPTNPTSESWALARGTSLDLRYVNVSPLGINRDRIVVGLWSQTLADPNHGFFAKPEGAGFAVTSYDVPGAYSTQLTGINDQGMIVGNYDNGNDKTRTRGPVFKLSHIEAAPLVFDPGEGYRAQSWGVSGAGWIHGYIEVAQPVDAVGSDEDAGMSNGG